MCIRDRGYIVKSLDFNNIPPELKAQVDQQIKDAGGEIQAIGELIKSIAETITKGHENTQKGLENTAIFKAFVESLTAEDLRREDIVESCIEDFFNASIEERIQAIELLDIFTVYRLYERKEAENAFTVPSPADAPETTEGAYKGLEKLQQRLLERLRKESTGNAPEELQGLRTIRRSPLAESGDALELRRNNGTGAEDITINITLGEES